MAPQGCFQFKRNISFGIILFFVIAEGGDILALDQPGAIAKLDIQQGYRAMTNGADHFAAFPHGLVNVVTISFSGMSTIGASPPGTKTASYSSKLAISVMGIVTFN